jgi:hypothetical protein
VKFKGKISKKLLYRLMLIIMLAGTALLFDVYLENHPETLEELQSENKNSSEEHNAIYLFSQGNSFNAKTPVQKTPSRKIFDDTHNKFLRKCHQLQGIQALKAKILPRKHLFISIHFLNYRNCYFSHPDDEPFIA